MMQPEKRFYEILEKAANGVPLTKSDCRYLLSFDETSYEAGVLRAAASAVTRRKSGNSAIILGQIGVDVKPCPGGCKFCTFGEKHTHFQPVRMTEDQLTERVSEFCRYDDLYGLYLMTMHDYDLDYFLRCVEVSRRAASPETQIWANVGDTSLEGYREMRAAGVTGVYHVCRLGEGKDTELRPEDRIRSMENALAAGLKLYTCCEPIGPEHTVEELVDNMFIGLEMGIFQHAAMRRVAVGGSPLAQYGQISELRLAQITAVIALAGASSKTMAYMGVHEPNTLGFTSGANIITAECGANPRDNASDTAKNRGMDMARCRKMLFESGYGYLRRGDESRIKLDFDYLVSTGSVD